MDQIFEPVAKEKAASRSRLNSIDFLRGLVMVVMALDHTRDFFAAGSFNPRDVTEPALFLTRWVTHFCAPTFIFLAGISAFLYGAGRKTSEISRYLFARGCWLILIEFTVVRFGWTFSFKIDYLVLQVIFAIGVSMIATNILPSRSGRMIDFGDIWEAFQVLAKEGGLGVIHAEDNDIVMHMYAPMTNCKTRQTITYGRPYFP